MYIVVCHFCVKEFTIFLYIKVGWYSSQGKGLVLRNFTEILLINNFYCPTYKIPF